MGEAARRAEAEGKALCAAVQAAGGQALPDDVRKAADAVRAGRPGEAADARRRAAERLDALAEALVERPADPVGRAGRPEADRLDALAEAQDLLRKKARDAGRIADPAARAEELQRLAGEQDRLRAAAQDALETLNRQRADAAARDLRDAVESMDAARDDLARGTAPGRPQGEAVEKLERARDTLDGAAAQAPRELAAEARRQLSDRVKALRDRQAAADGEAARLLTELLRRRAWERPLQTSLDELSGRERSLAEDARALAERPFADLPVLARLLTDAAAAMDDAARRAGERLEDAVAADAADGFDPAVEAAAADRYRRPMALALRRLEQLVEALKPDAPKGAAAPKPAPTGGGETGPAPAGATADVVPPLAQLKVLRSLQAEVNERTAAFAKAHPGAAALTEGERDELQDLERVQREVGALFDQIADLFPRPAEVP